MRRTMMKRCLVPCPYTQDFFSCWLAQKSQGLWGDYMKLKELLEGKSQVRIKEYEPWGNGVIFVGGCFYADNTFIQLDGNQYSANTEVAATEWDGNILMIMR